MQWAYSGIRKARKDTVKLNLVGVRSFEGLGALDRLGLEGLLLLMYPNWFFGGSFYRLEDGREVFRRVL